jgi:hypothetical protein
MMAPGRSVGEVFEGAGVEGDVHGVRQLHGRAELTSLLVPVPAVLGLVEDDDRGVVAVDEEVTGMPAAA